MKPFAVIGSKLPESQVGCHRVSHSQGKPSGEQTAFNWAQKQQLEADQVSLRALFGAMVRAAGGIDWLTAALDKQPSYATKIGEAINGVGDRKVQLEWIAPMLEDPSAVAVLLGWFCERTGHEPPLKRREVTKEQVAEAAIEVVAELGAFKDTFRDLVAKRLGVRPEEVKL